MTPQMKINAILSRSDVQDKEPWDSIQNKICLYYWPSLIVVLPDIPTTVHQYIKETRNVVCYWKHIVTCLLYTYRICCKSKGLLLDDRTVAGSSERPYNSHPAWRHDHITDFLEISKLRKYSVKIYKHIYGFSAHIFSPMWILRSLD